VHTFGLPYRPLSVESRQTRPVSTLAGQVLSNSCERALAHNWWTAVHEHASPSTCPWPFARLSLLNEEQCTTSPRSSCRRHLCCAQTPPLHSRHQCQSTLALHTSCTHLRRMPSLVAHPDAPQLGLPRLGRPCPHPPPHPVPCDSLPLARVTPMRSSCHTVNYGNFQPAKRNGSAVTRAEACGRRHRRPPKQRGALPPATFAIRRVRLSSQRIPALASTPAEHHRSSQPQRVRAAASSSSLKQWPVFQDPGVLLTSLRCSRRSL
jgi:hypothetical protein